MTEILDVFPFSEKDQTNKLERNRQETDNDYNSAEDLETDKNGKERSNGLTLQLPTPILQYNASSSSTFDDQEDQKPNEKEILEKNDQNNLSSKTEKNSGKNSRNNNSTINKQKTNAAALGTQPPKPNKSIDQKQIQSKANPANQKPLNSNQDQSNFKSVEQNQIQNKQIKSNANSKSQNKVEKTNNQKESNANTQKESNTNVKPKSPELSTNTTTKSPVKPSTTNPQTNPRTLNRKSQFSNRAQMSETGQKPIQTSQSQRIPKMKNKDLIILRSKQQHLADLKQAALYFEPLNNATEEDFEILLEDLNNDKQQSIIEHNFDQGEVVNGAIEHVLACQEAYQKQELQKKEVEKFIKQQNELDQKFQEYENETNRILNQIVVERDERLGYVRYRQLEEIKKHDEMWASESKMRHYNKASQSLKMNRKQLQDLLNQGRFREASCVQSMIDKLEYEERIQAMQLMQHDYNESLKKLKQRHQSELESQEKKWETQILQMKQKRINDMNTLVNKQRKIDSLRATVSDPDKIWNSTQMQRKKDMATRKVTIDPFASPQTARSRNAPSTSCSTRLSTRSGASGYAAQTEVSATIKLPPLKLSQSLPPTVPPMGFFSYR